MSKLEHLPHEATRHAYEQFGKKGIRAKGSIAFTSVYTLRQGVKNEPLPLWYVERYDPVRKTWLTAAADMQGDTLAGARNLVSGWPQYRVVVLNAVGAYVPFKR